MTWSKVIIFLPIFVLILEIFFIDSFYTRPNFNPTAEQNNNINQFENILKISNLQAVNLKVFSFRNEIQFYLKNVTVIFSSKLSPIIQVTALQNILKTSNIKGRGLKFIDLSSSHPYATFENN